MADDHASKAISCYGAGINQTPNLDRLEHEEMRFDHCYVTNSICTPGRAAVLTGTCNHVNGVSTLETPTDNFLPKVGRLGIDASICSARERPARGARLGAPGQSNNCVVEIDQESDV